MLLGPTLLRGGIGLAAGRVVDHGDVTGGDHRDRGRRVRDGCRFGQCRQVEGREVCDTAATDGADCLLDRREERAGFSLDHPGAALLAAEDD